MVQNWPRNLFLTCWKFSDFSTFIGVAPRSSGQGRSDLRIHSLSFTRKKASRKPQAAHRSENLKFYMCFLRFSDRCADRSAQEFYYKGQKSKSLRIVQKSFLDTKKVIVIFHLLGGGGKPTYGNFHMFGCFYFWKLPLESLWIDRGDF